MSDRSGSGEYNLLGFDQHEIEQINIIFFITLKL